MMTNTQRDLATWDVASKGGLHGRTLYQKINVNRYPRLRRMKGRQII